MSLVMSAHRPFKGSFPRVSGDEPWKMTENIGKIPFSPRERG